MRRGSQFHRNRKAQRHRVAPTKRHQAGRMVAAFCVHVLDGAVGVIRVLGAIVVVVMRRVLPVQNGMA